MKDFILLANINVITYKEVFPLLKDHIIRPGVVFNKTLEFDGESGPEKKNGIAWYTTLQTPPRRKLVLTKTYNPDDHPKYDNYDAVEVGRVKDIPYDYHGTMGVPITIFDYDLDHVEIRQICASHGKTPRGIENENCYLDGEWKYPRVLIKKNFEIQGLSADHRDEGDWCIKGDPTYIDEKHKHFQGMVKDGKMKYARILIKHPNQNPRGISVKSTPIK